MKHQDQGINYRRSVRKTLIQIKGWLIQIKDFYLTAATSRQFFVLIILYRLFLTVLDVAEGYILADNNLVLIILWLTVIPHSVAYGKSRRVGNIVGGVIQQDSAASGKPCQR